MERGERTRVSVGEASADVSLVKMSVKPKEAQHEVRKFVDDAVVGGKPFIWAPSIIWAPSRTVTSSATVTATTPPRARIERGVTREDGTWVDLTDELAAVDEATKIDGMAVLFTINAERLSMETIRDAHYVAPAGDAAGRFLAHLWAGLRVTKRAAIVRRTVRTNQALGALVARGRRDDRHLVLLTLEWAANIRPLPDRCRLLQTIPNQGAIAAADAMRSLHATATDAARLRDERMECRRELLEAARNGEAWEPPEAEPELDLPASWLRAVT